MNNHEAAFTNGFYRTPAGSLQSIAVAITSGVAKKSVEPGKVVLNGQTLPASAAVAAGMIDQVAADYIATQEATDKPAAFTREDPQREADEGLNKTPAQACIDALGAFFTSPTATSKAVAMNALEAHLKAAVGLP